MMKLGTTERTFGIFHIAMTVIGEFQPKDLFKKQKCWNLLIFHPHRHNTFDILLLNMPDWDTLALPNFCYLDSQNLWIYYLWQAIWWTVMKFSTTQGIFSPFSQAKFHVAKAVLILGITNPPKFMKTKIQDLLSYSST